MQSQEENPRKWVPEIMYEELGDEGITQSIPFVQVPPEKEMPGIIFMFASTATGETEPGPEGEELPITDLDLHQYANLAYIKEALTEDEYDKVRVSLGLEPLRMAAAKGQKITQNIRKNLV